MAGAGLLSLLPTGAAAVPSLGGLGVAKIALDETHRYNAQSAQHEAQNLRVEAARTKAAQDEANRQKELSQALARQRALMGAQGVQATGSALQSLDDLSARTQRRRGLGSSLLTLNAPAVESSWLRAGLRLAEETQ